MMAISMADKIKKESGQLLAMFGDLKIVNEQLEKLGNDPKGAKVKKSLLEKQARLVQQINDLMRSSTTKYLEKRYPLVTLDMSKKNLDMLINAYKEERDYYEQFISRKHKL